MSTLSLNSTDSQTSVSSRTPGASKLENVSFDKCPECRTKFDFIKRTGPSRIPLILSCKHTVCECCIKKLIRDQPIAQCPICNEDMGVERYMLEKLTDVFPPHFAMIGYLTWTKNNSKQHPGELVASGVTLKRRTLVDDPESENSISISSEDLENAPSYDYLKFEKCLEHQENFKNIFCQECNVVLCCYCFLMLHKGHEGDYLWHTSTDDAAALDKLKKEIDIVLKQLCFSYKTIKKQQVLDSSNAIPMMRKYVFDLHARLHIAETNIKKDLESRQPRDNDDLDEIAETVKQRIIKVRQLLSYFEESNKQAVNIRQLLKESDNVKGLPCRLVGQDSQEFASCNFDFFDRLEESFAGEFHRSNYNLQPIYNWDDENEDEMEFFPIVLTEDTSTREKNAQVKSNQLEAMEKKEEEKRSMISKLKEEGSIKIVLTHLNSLDSFYVIKHDDQTKVSNINYRIWKKPKSRLRETDVRIGFMYGVLFEVKNGDWWRRGFVQEIFKDGDRFRYKVFYVDFGNSQIVPIARLKELDSSLIKNPGFATECKLTNPEGLVFEENIHLQLPSLIKTKELYMQFVNNSTSSPKEVDIWVSTNTDKIVSMRDLISKKPLRRSEKEQVILKREQHKLFPNTNTFSIGQEEIIEVTSIDNPHEMFARLEENHKQFAKLKAKMKAFYDGDHLTSIIPVEKSDAIVKYKHSIYGQWHRSSIRSSDANSREANVFFVDWGGVATVSWSNIYSLTEEFKTIECLAFSLKLADIDTINKKPWTTEAIKFLRDQFLYDRKCNMQVLNKDPLEVALLLHRPTENICLNGLLVQEGYAISTGNISESVVWPDAADYQGVEDVDDDLVSQTIMKSQDSLVENEDKSFKHNEIKQQVQIIRFDSPDLIYIKFSKYKEKEDQMQRELLIHYNDTKKTTKSKWKPDEYCVVFDSVKNNYVRAVIREAIDVDNYLVYLYDYGRETKIQRQFVFVQHKYFEQFYCYVFKCRLAHVKPAGNGQKWTKLSLEILQRIFKINKIIYVKKVALNRKEKMLSVDMWYSLIKPAKALEPIRQDYISINRLLVECGVAFGEKLPIEQPLNEYNENQLNGRLQVNDSDDTSTSNWYQMICEDEAERSNLRTSWPSLPELTKTKFSAHLICIDDNGCFLLRDDELAELYLNMETNINESMSTFDATDQNDTWQINDMCMILYEHKYYRGKVIDITDDVDNNIHVEMIDFGSVHQVSKKDVTNYIMHIDCPPLLFKVQLYNVHSRHGQLLAEDIAKLIELSSDAVNVVIKSDLNSKCPLAEVYLDDGSCINKLITQYCPHLYRASMPEDNEKDECQNTTEEVIVKQNLFVYPFLSKKNDRKLKATLLNVLRVEDLFQAVFNTAIDDVPSYNQDFENLKEIIQALAEKQPKLKSFNISDSCVCFNNNMWRRGIIHGIDNIDDGYVLVFFVDYGTLDLVNVEHARQMDPLWFNLPVYNILATIDIQLIQKKMGEIVLMRLGDLRTKSIYVGVSSTEPLRVHLYKDEDFCYKDLIRRNIVVAL